MTHHKVVRKLSLFELTSEFGSEVARELVNTGRVWAQFSNLENAPCTPTFISKEKVQQFLEGTVDENGEDYDQ